MEDSPGARRPHHQLKTRQMALLMAIDETRNLHQAALSTHMSQPAASTRPNERPARIKPARHPAPSTAMP